MQIQSPLSNLRDVLAQAKYSARQYSQQFQSDEAGTRLALIDPVLSALGWQLWNPLMVRVESTIQSYRADYILLDSGQSPNIIVEAKPLGTVISAAQRNQLFSYAAKFNAKSAFITNGSEWEHYEDTIALSKHTLKWQKSLASDNINEVATYLIQRLDAANVWSKEDDIDTIEQRLAQVESDTQTLLQKSARTNPIGPVPAVTPPPLPNFINLSALPDLTGTRPSQLRLPDGKTQTVRSWGSLLVECCKFSLTANPSITIPFSDAAGGNVNLLSDVQSPHTIDITPNGNTIYVRRLYDANRCVANARHILAQVPPVKMLIEAAVAYS